MVGSEVGSFTGAHKHSTGSGTSSACVMASARPPPEVLSVAAPAASLSAHRVFVSLSVLLVFLLIAYFKPDRTPRNKPVAVRAAGKRNTKTVLLVGPLAAGKTALFSKVSTQYNTFLLTTR